MKIEYSYDANGNITTYQYDEENHLIGATTSSGAVSFEYDELGRRISKTVNSFTDNWIYDGNEVIEDNNSRVYVHGRSIDERLGFFESGGVSYYLADALGSVRKVVDSTGSESQSYTYKDFGKIKSSLGTTSNRYTFTGREYDSEMGFYYYRNRSYNPIIGRFIQEDPIGFGDVPNLYSYVGNNPVNYIDPIGLAKMLWPMTFWKGPRYGNWGGGKWSGGWDVDEHGGKMGNAPYVDSLDFCCMKHDFCWYKCEKKFPCEKDKEKRKKCIKDCNNELIDCLKKLDKDPRKWKEPPKKGTEEDADEYRKAATNYFEYYNYFN